MSFCYSAERLCTSVASVADCHMLPALLHGEERKVWGDGGYQGQTKAIQEAAPHAQDMTCRRTKYTDRVDELQKKKNTTKSRVRSMVEHPFRILKRASSALTRYAIEASRRIAIGCA
jgi:IS5 family transposase